MPSSDSTHGFVPLGGTGRAPAFRALADAKETPLGPTVPAAPPPEEEAAAPAPIEEHPAFAAGQAAARAELEPQLDDLRATVARALESLAVFRRDLRTRYERDLLMLALGVARKVVHEELRERPEIWLEMIRNGVQQAVDREHIRVRVPPLLGEWLRGHADTLHARLQEVKGLEILDDPSLPPGGCIVESRFGDVDVGVDSQLAAAERALVRAEGPS